jgi:hypothetical protein
MPTSVWSLENKARDIENALARQDLSSARMYAYEFGIRLEHAQHKLELSRRNTASEPSVGEAEIRISDLVGSLRSELERSRASLVEQRLDAAEQAFAKVRSLLAQLSRCVGDA